MSEKTDDKSNSADSQSEKFKKLAREIEADEDEKAFKAKLKKLAKPEPEKDKPTGKGTPSEGRRGRQKRP